MFVKVTGEKLVGGIPSPFPTILNRVKIDAGIEPNVDDSLTFISVYIFLWYHWIFAPNENFLE